jgi:hypothetical protein
MQYIYVKIQRFIYDFKEDIAIHNKFMIQNIHISFSLVYFCI